jgi:uncharacterized protein
MQVNLDSDISSYTIRAYQPGEIAITLPIRAEPDITGPMEVEVITSSFVISPRHLIRDWPPTEIDNLLSEHLDVLAELQPEVVIIGTGHRLQFPESKILAQLHNQQVGVEIMDTAAACRTYNILMTEGRFVVAGMINTSK